MMIHYIIYNYNILVLEDLYNAAIVDQLSTQSPNLLILLQYERDALKINIQIFNMQNNVIV